MSNFNDLYESKVNSLYGIVLESAEELYDLHEDKGLMDYLTFKFNQWNRLQKNPIKDKGKAKAEFKKMLDAKDEKIKDWMKEYSASKGKN